MFVEHNQVPQAVLNAVQALGIPLDKCQFVDMDAEDTAGDDTGIKETGVGNINYGDTVRCVSEQHPTFDGITWPVTVGGLYEVVVSPEGTPCVQMNDGRNLHLNNFSYEPIAEDREFAPAGQIDTSAMQALFDRIAELEQERAEANARADAAERRAAFLTKLAATFMASAILASADGESLLPN
jgi:hypothetical protein